MDKKAKKVKTLRILLTLFVILLCGFFAVTLFMNKEITRLDNEKSNVLVIHNNAMNMIKIEITNYLNVVNNETWTRASNSTNLSENARIQVYGEEFSSFRLPNVTEYKIIDVLYDITENETIVYSVDTFLKIKEQVINRNFLVSFDKENGLIESIETY